MTGPRRDDWDSAGRRDPRYYPPRPPADAGEQHPGMANYPSDPGYRRASRSNPTPSANRWLPPLDEPARPHTSRPPPHSVGAGAGQRVTVTRAAAQRSREMGSNMYGMVHRAATAVGGDKDLLMNPDLLPDDRLSVGRAAQGLADVEEARAELAEDINLNTRLVVERAFLGLAELTA